MTAATAQPQIKTGDTRIRVVHDSDPQSPRDDDNLGTITGWHRRYTVGDKHSFERPDNFFLSLIEASDIKVVRKILGKMLWANRELWEDYKIGGRKLPGLHDKTNLEGYIDAYIDVEECQEIIRDVLAETILIMPVHMYDHSGVSYSTEPFSCPWDSGQVGFMWATHENIRKSGFTSENWLDRATEVLKLELKTYNQFVSGDVWGFVCEQATVCDQGHAHWEDIDSCWGFFGTDFDNGMADHFAKEDHEKLKEALDNPEHG